jgi:hypothetical protein
MGRKFPKRRGSGSLGNLEGLAAEANQLAAAAREPGPAAEDWGYPSRRAAATVESRPIPTVGFGHDPNIGSRQRKARMAAAAAGKQKTPKNGTVRRS